jgi:hypothetical protein
MRWWPYTAGRRRPTWPRPYPFTRGCIGEFLFHSLLTLALTLCFCYPLYTRSALCHSTLLITTEPTASSHWPRAPSTASFRAAIHEESHRLKHSEELHPVHFCREEELAVGNSPLSSSGHIATSSSIPVVHWYSSTRSSLPTTLRPHPTTLHPKLDSPLTRLAPRSLHRRPLVVGRPNFLDKPPAPFCWQATSADGGGELPCSGCGPKQPSGPDPLAGARRAPLWAQLTATVAFLFYPSNYSN